MANWARLQGLNLRSFSFSLIALCERANFLDILSVVVLGMDKQGRTLFLSFYWKSSYSAILVF